MKLHLAWAEQEEKEGRVEEARNILSQISNTNKDIDLVMKRVDLEVRQIDIVKAIDILENNLEAEVSAAETVKLVMRLVMLLTVNGEAGKAEKLVTDAIGKDKHNAELYRLKIDLLKIKGNHKEIVNVCVNALKNVPKAKKLFLPLQMIYSVVSLV